jgi:hypothetical protein
VNAAEQRAYSLTPAGIFARATGSRDTAEQDIAVRAAAIIEEYRLEHLFAYGTEVRMSQEQATATARAELGVTVPAPVSSWQLAESVKWASPACQVGVIPEQVTTGIGTRHQRPGSAAEYSGDPVVVQRMKAADLAREQRQAAADGRLGALGRQIA